MATYKNFLNTDITNKKKLQEDIAAFREQHFPAETEPPTTSNDTSDFVKRSNERYRSMLTRQIYNRDFDWEPIQTVGDLNPNQYYGTSVYDKGASNISDYANLNNYRADEQSGFLKLVNGTVNALFKLGTSAVNAVATIPTMGVAAITKNQDDRSWFAEWATNPITQGLQNMEDAFKQNIAPIYRDDSSRERSWAQNAITPGSGFWAEDVIENIGFTLGSLYGGKAVVGAFNKIANRISTKVGTRALSRLAAAQGESGVKAFIQENIGKSAQELENAFSQINNRFKGFGSVAVGVTTGALGEAQMEASHAYNDYIEQNINYANSFFDKNNPSLQIMYYDAVSKGYENSFEKYIEEKRNETYADIKRTADSIAKGVFCVQSILLTATNWLTFANFFKGSSGLRSNMMMRAKPFLKTETKQIATESGKKLNIITSIKERKRPLLSLWRTIEPPLVEGFEEMGQGFITEAYTQYNGAALNDDFYQDYQISLNPAYEQNAINWLNAVVKGSEWMTDFNNQIEGIVGAVFGAIGVPGGRIRKSKQKTTNDKFRFQGGIQESIQELRTARESAKDIVKKVEGVINGDEQVTFSTLKNYYTVAALNDIESFAELVGDKKTELDAQHGKIMSMARLYNEVGMSDDFIDLLDSIANMDENESNQFIKTLEQLYLKDGQSLSEEEKKEILANVKERVIKQSEEVKHYYDLVKNLRKTLGRQFNGDEKDNTNAKLGDELVQLMANQISMAKNKETRINEIVKNYKTLLDEIRTAFVSDEDIDISKQELSKDLYASSTIVKMLKKALPELTVVVNKSSEENEKLAEDYFETLKNKLMSLEWYKSADNNVNIIDAIKSLRDLYFNSIEFEKIMSNAINNMGKLLDIKEAKELLDNVQKKVDNQQLANLQAQIIAYSEDTTTENYDNNLKTIYNLLQKLKNADENLYEKFKEKHENTENPVMKNALNMMKGEEIKVSNLNRINKKYKIGNPTIPGKISELMNVPSYQLKEFFERKRQDASISSADKNDWNIIENELRVFYGDQYDELSTNRAKYDKWYKNKTKSTASKVKEVTVPVRTWDSINTNQTIEPSDKDKEDIDTLAKNLNIESYGYTIKYLGDGKLFYSTPVLNILGNDHESSKEGLKVKYEVLYNIFTNNVEYIKFIDGSEKTNDTITINNPTLNCTSDIKDFIENYLDYILKQSSLTSDFAKALKVKLRSAVDTNSGLNKFMLAVNQDGEATNKIVHIFHDNVILTSDSKEQKTLDDIKRKLQELVLKKPQKQPEEQKYSSQYETDRQELKIELGIDKNPELGNVTSILDIIAKKEKLDKIGLDTAQHWLNDRGFYAKIEGESDDTRIVDIIAFEDQDNTGYTREALANTYVRWKPGQTINLLVDGKKHSFRISSVNSNNTIEPVVTDDGVYRIEYISSTGNYRYTPLKKVEERTAEQKTSAHDKFSRNTELISFGDYSDVIDGVGTAGNAIRYSINKILNAEYFKNSTLTDSEKKELVDYLISLHLESYSFIGSGKLNKMFTANPNLVVKFRKKAVDPKFKNSIKEIFNLKNIINGDFLIEIFVEDEQKQTHSLGFVKPDALNGNKILLHLSQDPKFKTDENILDYTTTIDEISINPKKISTPEDGKPKPIKKLLGINDGLTPRIIIINKGYEIIADNDTLTDIEKTDIKHQIEGTNIPAGAHLVLYQAKSGTSKDGESKLPYELIIIKNANTLDLIKYEKGVAYIEALNDLFGLKDSLIQKFFELYKNGNIEEAKKVGYKIQDMLLNRLYSSSGSNYVKLLFNFNIENGQHNIVLNKKIRSSEFGKTKIEDLNDLSGLTNGTQEVIEFDAENPNVQTVINKIIKTIGERWNFLIQFDTEAMNPNADPNDGFLSLKQLIDGELISVSSNTVYETHSHVILNYQDVFTEKQPTKETIKQNFETGKGVYNLNDKSFNDDKFLPNETVIDSNNASELVKILDGIVNSKDFIYRVSGHNKYFVITDRENNPVTIAFTIKNKKTQYKKFDFDKEKWDSLETKQNTKKEVTKIVKPSASKRKSEEAKPTVTNITINVGAPTQTSQTQPEDNTVPEEIEEKPVEQSQTIEEKPEEINDKRIESIKKILKKAFDVENEGEDETVNKLINLIKNEKIMYKMLLANPDYRESISKLESSEKEELKNAIDNISMDSTSDIHNKKCKGKI